MLKKTNSKWWNLWRIWISNVYIFYRNTPWFSNILW